MNLSTYPQDFSPSDQCEALGQASLVSMFSWSVENGEAIIEGYTRCSLGPLASLLTDMQIYDFTYHVTGKDEKGKDIVTCCWYPNRKADSLFYWREERLAFEQCPAGIDPRSEIAIRAGQRASRDEGRGIQFLSRLAGWTTLRLAPHLNWRPLACNPVLHFQFGLGYAVASDGARVLLTDRCRIDSTTQWFLAHAKNVVGVATATPTPAKGGDRGIKTNKPSQVDIAMSALSKLLAL